MPYTMIYAHHLCGVSCNGKSAKSNLTAPWRAWPSSGCKRSAMEASQSRASCHSQLMQGQERVGRYFLGVHVCHCIYRPFKSCRPSKESYGLPACILRELLDDSLSVQMPPEIWHPPQKLREKGSYKCVERC